MGIIPQRYDKPRDPLRVGANPAGKELGYAAGQLGYAQVTASQVGISVKVDLTNLAVTVIVGANRRIKITGHAPQFTNTSGVSSFVTFYIQEGATRLNFSTEALNDTYTGAECITVITPSAGTHTYKLQAESDGVVTMFAASDAPAFILVEDIGASI